MKTFPLALALSCLCLIALSAIDPAAFQASDPAPVEDAAAMTSPFAQAETLQVDTIRRYGSEVVFISAGVETPLKAFIGTAEPEERSDNQMSRNVTLTRITDFLIPTEDLPGQVTRGVELQLQGGRYRPASNGNEPLTVLSRHGFLTRIHTTRVST